MMRVGFGSTVLARGMAHGGVDGIGSYTRELMQRLAQSPDLALKPFAYSGPMPPEMVASVVHAGDFQRQALMSLATGLPFRSMQKVFAGKVDLVHATDHKSNPHLPPLGRGTGTQLRSRLVTRPPTRRGPARSSMRRLRRTTGSTPSGRKASASSSV